MKESVRKVGLVMKELVRRLRTVWREGEAGAVWGGVLAIVSGILFTLNNFIIKFYKPNATKTLYTSDPALNTVQVQDDLS